MDETEATAKAVETLIGLAVNVWTIGASVVVYLALRFATRAFDAIADLRFGAVWRRILPLVPELIAVPACILGGLPPVTGQPLGIRIAVGLWVAYLSTKAQKLLGQTVLGDDAKIEAAITRGPRAPDPADRVSEGRSIAPLSSAADEITKPGVSVPPKEDEKK